MTANGSSHCATVVEGSILPPERLHVQFELYDPRPREIPEEYVIRPVYKEGAEVLVYHDNAVLHSTPDYIDREAVWRFM